MWWRIRRYRGKLLGRLKNVTMELFGLLFAFLLVLLYKLLNKIVPDDDKNKDKRDDIERWNDHLNYRG